MRVNQCLSRCSWMLLRMGVCLAGVALMVVLPAQVAFGQWTTGSGGAIYYNGGNVGIGTTSPVYAMDAYNTISTRGNGSGLVLWPRNNPNNASGTYVWYTPTGSELRLYSGSYGDILAATSSGNVGIGTTNPQYKLTVNGNIGAQDITVTSTGLADYVFKPGYRLRPLSEISTFIQKHHHLPEIPSEREAKAKGVSVGEMQAKLLAKVEELTLHLIRQDQENQELRKRLAQLERRIAK